MNFEQPVWLPHLNGTIVSEALGHELCAYVVALEGWRRGLTLNWYTKDAETFQKMETWHVDAPGKLFSLTSKEKTHYFFRTRGDKVSNEAVRIGADKEKTKKLLAEAGVSVPDGSRFSDDARDEEVIDYASAIGFPVVLKPTEGSFGKGVITNIQNKKELRKALKKVPHSNVLVERFISGEEYRLYVVGQKVVGAIHRIPANVAGDGQTSIEALIDRKNKQRQYNPRLISCPIQMDDEVIDFVHAKGYKLESIPKEGDRIFLREKSNISLGGDPVDVTDDLHPAVKQTAVHAVDAVPGLYHGGVDLIIDKNKPPEHAATIIELNPTAQIGSLLYPLKGHARDIPAAIIDEYFPETKGNEKEKTSFYFGFDRVLEPLKNKSSTRTTVFPVQSRNVYAKKYTVSGQVQGVHYHRELREQALAAPLHGFINNLDNGNIEVVVAGTSQDLVDTFKETLLRATDDVQVTDVCAENWVHPVKIGFDIQADPNKITDEISKIEQEKAVMKKEKEKAERKYLQYQQSRSWKLTLPLRKALNYMKRQS
ncbi:ATP-grasp domain-containing protein [Salicibibacter halophilus]|uniref:Acylphosphatase n=1 Tax=Salicibibacter halophilus TaxID=2502791 RepID=A0A514LK00_9BACI|nr:acylphosphatase [Salicibibacter halophilus]QDI91611.1 ATP-grasp domain-containing protein [Salicibibacter halophilus]